MLSTKIAAKFVTKFLRELVLPSSNFFNKKKQRSLPQCRIFFFTMTVCLLNFLPDAVFNQLH